MTIPHLVIFELVNLYLLIAEFFLFASPMRFIMVICFACVYSAVHLPRLSNYTIPLSHLCALSVLFSSSCTCHVTHLIFIGSCASPVIYCHSFTSSYVSRHSFVTRSFFCQAFVSLASPNRFGDPRIGLGIHVMCIPKPIHYTTIKY